MWVWTYYDGVFLCTLHFYLAAQGGGGGGLNPLNPPPPRRSATGLGALAPQIKLNHVCFLQFHTYITCRQIKISFLGVPQIAHFQVEKCKSSLPWEEGHPLPHPTPAPSLRSLGPGRFAPSQRLRPQMFSLITPLFVMYSNFMHTLST